MVLPQARAQASSHRAFHLSGVPSTEIVRSTHTMTLPFLDRAFDVIFVVAGDNEASFVHELFNVRNRRFKHPVELVQPKSRNVL